MPDITKKLKVVIEAQDRASAKLGKFSGALKMAGVAVGAFAVGMGVKAVQAAASFESGMTNVATLLDTSTENMDEMGKKVKEISKRIPVDMVDLTTALYNVRSAGIDAADAMDVLETSGKLAVAGLSTTEEAVDLLTSAINVYGDESHNSEQLADILFKTVKAGKTTVSELAQGFGKVAAIAKETGISIEDLSAATAVLTTGGIKAAEAQTALKAMISNVLKPTKDAIDVSEKLGISFNLGALEAKGLSGMLVEIADKAGDDKQALADLFGSVEAANAIFALTSEDGGAAMKKVLEDINSGTDSLTEGFNKQTESAANQYKMLKNNLNVAMIDLGTVILPPLVSMMKALPGILEKAGKGWDFVTTALSKVFIAADKVNEAVARAGRTTGKVGRAIGGFLTGSGRGEKNIPFLPFFQKGGVVPGLPSQPVPIMAHGGETIIPADKEVGNSYNYNFNFSNAMIADKDQLIREIKSVIDRESELRNLGGT